jgi:hypothetical protein
MKVGDILYRNNGNKSYSFDFIIISGIEKGLSTLTVGFFISWYNPNWGKHNRYDSHFTATYSFNINDWTGFLNDANNDIKHKFKIALINGIFTTKDTDRLELLNIK